MSSRLYAALVHSCPFSEPLQRVRRFRLRYSFLLLGCAVLRFPFLFQEWCSVSVASTFYASRVRTHRFICFLHLVGGLHDCGYECRSRSQRQRPDDLVCILTRIYSILEFVCHRGDARPPRTKLCWGRYRSRSHALGMLRTPLGPSGRSRDGKSSGRHAPASTSDSADR